MVRRAHVEREGCDEGSEMGLRNSIASPLDRIAHTSTCFISWLLTHARRAQNLGCRQWPPWHTSTVIVKRVRVLLKKEEVHAMDKETSTRHSKSHQPNPQNEKRKEVFRLKDSFIAKNVLDLVSICGDIKQKGVGSRKNEAMRGILSLTFVQKKKDP